MRGIFYSFAALLFILPLIMLSMVNMNYYSSGSETATSKIIGNKLLAFSKSVDNDMPRALEIMAKNALSNAVVYVETNGTALNDAGDVLTELVENGTIYGTASPTNFTISSWTIQLRQKGMSYGFDTDIRVLNITFLSAGSYNIKLVAQISVNATKPSSGIGVYKVYWTEIPVSIENFDDPLYTLGTNGVIKRSIKMAEMNLSGAANFGNAVAFGFYMPSAEGAGFLDRLEGRLRGSGKYNTTAMSGLESVVYVPSLQANGISIKPNQTDIDYMYFDNATYSGSSVNQSSYGWLKIDGNHAAVYNLTLI
jgi:uncharacterized protein YbjQ (UPF0145 family)